MKIKLADNVIFSAALAKAENGEYFDALCLFARVNSYESMLNQIGCLCALRDIGYATELYRNLLSKYYFTHNCNDDLAKLGDATEHISAYVRNSKDSSVRKDDSKVSADEDLLAFYSVDYDDYFDADDIDNLSDALEYTLGETSKKSVFYDVKSQEFYFNLCHRMERAFLDGNFELAHELRRQFMSIETDDVPTLELQLFLCLTQQQWELGIPYAIRYATLPSVTARGMGASVQILSRVGAEHKDVIEQLLVKLTNYGEEITDLAMMDYIQIASSTLGYGEVTLKLTKILYGHYKEAGCCALSLCARTFFNCGDYETARNAILLLLRAVPWDGVAAAYLTYFNKRVGVALDGVTTINSMARHYDIPSQLSVVAQYVLLSDMDQNNLVLGSDSYPLIKCLFKLCLGCIVKGDAEKFFSEMHALSALLVNFTPQNKEEFFLLAKECLASVLSEPSMNKDFLCKMIELGYRGEVVMSTSSGYYTLDLSRLTVTDKAFVVAFAVCASLRTVSVRIMEKNYKQIKKVLNVQFDDDIDTVRQLAFALLALSYKRFMDSDEGAYFSVEEHALYKQYLEKLQF